MQSLKLYKCMKCNNLIQQIDGSNTNIECCNTKMTKIEANTFEASTEKHIPVYELSNSEIIVTIGEIEHPMEEDHYIMWVMLESNNEVTKINLKPGDLPKVRFKYISNSTLYAYCNKHGLWKKEVK